MSEKNQPQAQQASVSPKTQQQSQLQHKTQILRAQLRNPEKCKKFPKKIRGIVLVDKRKRDNVHKFNDKMKFKPKTMQVENASQVSRWRKDANRLENVSTIYELYVVLHKYLQR